MKLLKKLSIIAVVVLSLAVMILPFSAVALGGNQPKTSAEPARAFSYNQDLAGKSILFYGDSITARLGLQSSDKDYIQILQKEFGFYAYNTAVSGATWINEGGNTIFGQMSRTQYMYRDVDCISIFLGTNDFGGSRALGTINDTTDKTTYGAMNKVLSEIIAANPDVKIMLMTPLWRGDNNYVGFDTQNAKGYTLADIRTAVKAIGEKYECKVVDFTDVFNASNAGQYMLSDKLHVKPLGYEKIAEALKNA